MPLPVIAESVETEFFAENSVSLAHFLNMSPLGLVFKCRIEREIRRLKVEGFHCGA